MLRVALPCAALVLAAAPQARAQDAQPTPFRRLPLQQEAYPAPGHSTHMLLVEVQPGATIPRHTHPGIEMGYMVEGEAELEMQGQPARRVRAGESYHVPAGTPHLLRNGPGLARVAVTYVVERDKPLSSPAP